MFAGKKINKKTGSSSVIGTRGNEHELSNKRTSSKSKKQHQFEGAGYDERQGFLIKNKIQGGSRAKLAKQETLEQEGETVALNETANGGGANQMQTHCCSPSSGCCCSAMLLKVLKWKWILIPPLFIVCCIAAIYCIPFIDIEARTPMSLPHIPFNYREGPLRDSTASQFKIERLFADQISAPESVALDSQGNMYLAIEGGFILYAHLNKSSMPMRPYYTRSQAPFDVLSPEYTELVKIAELNGIKQLHQGQGVGAVASVTGSGHHQRRSTPAAERVETGGGAWRRECQLDEQIYGKTLHTGGPEFANSNVNNEDRDAAKKFVSKVAISRCSKPLGVRLSPNEDYLYVVDTLSGLYRVDLKVQERASSTQRQVNRLINFRANRDQLLPVISLDEQQQPQLARPREQLNISLIAIDDLAIDYGAGSHGGDVIYLTAASQNWQALSFIYDMLEGRPSGAILRLDTGTNQMSVLSPARVAHVRTSVLEFDDGKTPSMVKEDVYLGLGAPRLNEDDVFDDRPLHFPNGLEIMDDKQAILIADTINKRIIKHYIRGSRRGTSDLWAWTPHFPDNIRRGYDRAQETYWVVGCGEDTTNKVDLLAWLHSWPRLKKYLLKNFYLIGWTIEMVGGQILGSTSVRDFGYSLKVGHSLSESLCPGMMILQHNKYGDVIRSIYSKEFPSDIRLYSQVDEVIDSRNQEHILYLSSPGYKYLTKLVLPSDSLDLPQQPPSSSMLSSSFPLNGQ